ncbi:hypothetical protein L208DRAFT_1395086, partial [Tricholoma matsutake]
MTKSDLSREDKALTSRNSSESGPSVLFQQSTSANIKSANPTRPLTRTKSRPRFGRYSEPDIRSPLQAPDLDIFNADDSSRFLDLVKTVAERVDENAGFRAAKKESFSGMKRKIRDTNSINAVDARARRSRLAVTAKDEARVGRTKGLHKEDSGTEPEHESNSSDSLNPGLLRLSSSSFTSSTSSSSLHSINTCVHMDVEVADTSSSSSAADPTPDTRSPTSANPTVSVPRLHPLLSQQHPPPRALPPQPAQQPPHVSILTQAMQRPSASQMSAMTRPPALGMRRTHSMIATSLTANAPLPTRQKAFKPPLRPQTRPHLQTQSQLRPPQSQSLHPAIRNVEKDKMHPVKTESGTSHWGQGGHNKEAPDYRPSTLSKANRSSTEAEPDSNPDADADSSFGDMSFDIDALEETMRMY